MGLSIGKTERRKPQLRAMARRPRGHEKIFMNKKRFGYFPEQFIWRGHCYDVHAVERCWTVSRRRFGNRVERLCFRVRGAAANVQDSGARRPRVSQGTFYLYQDLRAGRWHLERVVSEA